MMKKPLIFLATMIGLITASCSNDEPMPNSGTASNQIRFSVIAENGSRSTSHYENGTDISHMSVSAWVVEDTTKLPAYSESNTGNGIYFLNDFLTRTPGSSGTFNYSSGARYWPSNNEILDFFAVVDNPVPFKFNQSGKGPGLDWINQGQLTEMPDMLYAYTPNQTRGKQPVAQQNVSFSFNHAFAKVVVTAEVRNPNLRVYITDMSIVGVINKGQFLLPHKVGEGKKIVNVEAQWILGTEYMNLTNLMKLNDATNPAVLDMAGQAKWTLLSESHPNDLLVIPASYSGRNSSKPQTYIQLKGYAYNIANQQNGFDADTDVLIYPKKNADGTLTPAIINIPIEFNWKAGTINRYNIVFDCGNGGYDPENPAFVRIGYEVEVNPWKDGESNETEYNKK